MFLGIIKWEIFAILQLIAFFYKIPFYGEKNNMFYFFEELTTELSINECLLFSLIHSIYYRNIQEGETRCFFASNSYIADRLGLSKRTIISAIQRLKELEYVQVNYSEDENRIVRRTIIPKLVDFRKELDWGIGVVKNLQQGGKNSARGVLQNLQHINKYLDNKSINIDIRPTSEKTYVNSRIEGADAPVATSGNPHLNHQAVKDKWNAIAQRYHLQSINTITTQRATALKARFNDIGGEDAFWSTVENAIKNSPFLRGQNNRKWRASFDWVITQSRFVKLAEGVYSSGGSLLDDPQKPIQEAADKDWIDDFFTFGQEAK